MAERKIKHKAFRYSVEAPDPVRPDETVLRQRIARRNDVVDLREEDIRRGEHVGAFYTDEELEEQSSPEVVERTNADVEDVAEMDLDETVAWLQEERPNAPRTISAAGGDPEVAERLMEAEQLVTGRDPRSSVVTALQRIIDESDDEE